jgi:hypothetical protein
MQSKHATIRKAAITLSSSDSESELSDSELSAGFFAGTDPFLAAAAAAFGFGA